jgi:hypothetical protein
MLHKYSDYRWASPKALKRPPRPAPHLDRTSLDALFRWIVDPDSNVCVPVYPDGEIISDESVATVLLMNILDVKSVRTYVAWMDCRQDVDFYESIGIDVVSDAHPELRAELEALTDRCAARPIKSSAVETWWVGIERPSPLLDAATALHSPSEHADNNRD